MELFGWFKDKSKKSSGEQLTFAAPSNDDGAIVVEDDPLSFGGGQTNQLFDLDKIPTNEFELLNIYRTMSLSQEVDEALQEIFNEAIISDDESPSVSISLNSVDLSQNIKDKITEEFESILRMLNFKTKAYSLFSRWYIDGKIIFHKAIDSKSKTIEKLVPIDPANIKLVRKIKKKKTDDQADVFDLSDVEEYYIYSKVPFTNKGDGHNAADRTGLKIPKDAVTYCTSGLMDETGKNVISYLYKAIKPWNNLKLMEDSLIIYRVTRAPDRRVFYIDVGNLPKGKAEQYLKDIMNRFRNKTVYDATTGTISNQRKYNSMIEDYWLPRREGGQGTQIETLDGGQQLGEINDTQYFKDKLIRSLNVPVSRLQQEASAFNLGRTSEITRDEVKFSKFISRLRKRFSYIFDDILKTQLVLKKIITEDEWDEIVDDVYYTFLEDNFFSELKEVEILRERLETVSQLQAGELIGRYYSNKFVRMNILKQTEEDIERLDKEIKEEEPVEEPNDLEVNDNNPTDSFATSQQKQKESEPKDTEEDSGIKKSITIKQEEE